MGQADIPGRRAAALDVLDADLRGKPRWLVAQHLVDRVAGLGWHQQHDVEVGVRLGRQGQQRLPEQLAPALDGKEDGE